MRCFIAIDLPEEIKRQIGNVINLAAPLSKDIKWVPYENIHMTLKFLGEVKEDTLPEIEQKLRDICSVHAPFSISVRGTGAFPNEKNPNVIWIGVDKSDRLKSLYLDIDNSLSEAGFEKESRKHSPHLTIGRVKNRKDILQVMNGLNEFKSKLFGNVDIVEVHLMKSILKPSGAEYSKVCSFRLNGEKVVLNK